MPACDAITSQVPLARNVIVAGDVAPLSEHTVPAPWSSASPTVSPLDAVAVTVYVPFGSGFAGTVDVNATVWLAFDTVIVVSALGDPATIRACLAAGVLGYVSKQARPEEVLQALQAALRGEQVMSPEVASALLHQADGQLNLSEQERRAMVLYASGLKMESVARRMNVSRTTAEEYIKRVRAKARKAGTPLPTKTDMYRMAQRAGMLP